MSVSDSGEMRLVNFMEQQEHMQAIHEQRITQVETRVTTLEIKFPYLDNAISKLTNIAEQQTKQGALTEQAVDTLAKGQEQHRRTIEDLTRGQVDMKARFESLWRVLAVIGSGFVLAGAGYLFSLLEQHHP